MTEVAPGLQDWIRAAEASLRGKALDEIAAVTEDGIGVDPVAAPAMDAGALPGLSADAPTILPEIAETSADACNQTILAELGAGCGGARVRIAGPETPGLPADAVSLVRALDGVYLDAARIALGGADKTVASALIAHAESGPAPLGIDLGLVAGEPICGVERPGLSNDEVAELGGRCQSLGAATVFVADGRGAHEAGATAAQELAAMLAGGVAALRSLENSGIAPAEGAGLITLDLAVDADLFESIAKLRAARRLWSSVLTSSGADPSSISLQAATSARMMAAEDVYTNMLRTTAAVAAAQIGGAESVTVLPFTHALGRPDGFARRIARNTAIVLAEESWLGAVSDPARGSGHIEQLTDGLCELAWALFQEIERSGPDALVAAIDIARNARQKAISDGGRPLVGVNTYRNTDERLPSVETWASTESR